MGLSRRLALASGAFALLFLTAPLAHAASPTLGAEIKASLTELREPAAAAAAGTTTATAATPAALPASADLVALTRPAIVRVLAHLNGTTTVPTLVPDFTTLTWKTSTKTTPIPYDAYISGSGFVVNPDGYIVTNAHVVTTVELAQEYAAQLIEDDLFDTLFTLSPAQLDAESNVTSAQFEQFVQAGITELESEIIFAPPTIVILKPTAPAPATTTSAEFLQDNASDELTQAAAIMASGTPATIIYANQHFLDDQRDVAVLKADQSNLPAIRLGNSDSVTVGAPIYVFGFPASADFNGISQEPTFTAGTVNALKSSTQNTFKYIQTDAAASEGSSGSPVFDAQGAVVGILTEQEEGGLGSTFAFAIPINLVTSVLADASIATSTPGDYISHYLAGETYQDARECKDAIAEYQAAEGANPIFTNVNAYVDPHIAQCQALIASGQSLDTWWEKLEHTMSGYNWWLIGAGILLALLLILAGLWGVRRMRKEEKLIESLEEEMKKTPGAQAAPAAAPAAAVVAAAPTVVPAALTDFVRQARASKMPEAQMRASLIATGWPAPQVDAALRP